MNNTPIYKAEASIEGLADKIRASSSVQYAVPIESNISEGFESIRARIVANLGLTGSEDLFFVNSVLVSTNWNKNDDVFSKEPSWAARKTPIHKPTNIEHDEKAAVGHMVDTWVVNKDGELVADDSTIDDLPDLFHICNSSVIYRAWQDEELKQRAEDLIVSIEAGEMFVSMECLFAGFDYAVVDPDHNSFIVPRNESTAFLTKHLKSYGGEGEFNGNRVGRLLKNIVFSGKGFVKKPANPNSIIFFDKPAFDFVEAQNASFNESGVYFTEQPSAAVAKDKRENSNMSSEHDMLKEQVSKLEAALTESNKAQAEAERKLAEADIAAYQTQIDELKAEVEVAAQKDTESQKATAETQSKVDELTKQVDELSVSKTELEKQLSQVEAEKTATSRVSTLVDGGISKEDAETKVETFSSLTDDQFAALATELIEAVKAKSQNNEDDKSQNSESSESSEEEDGADANADEKVLEDAEASTEGTVGSVDTSDDETEVEESREAIASFLATEYLKIDMTSDESEED